jgi:hypothetical protein
MTTRDETEEMLRSAVAVTPSEDGLRWLDERVSQVVARPAAARHRWSSSRPLVRPVVLLAAFLLLTGAVIGGVGLLNRLFETSGLPGWYTAWDRAERLAMSQSDAGVTITLERAYADLNQVLVGFTVEGLEAPPGATDEHPAPIEWVVELRDPAGRTAEHWATSQLALGVQDTQVSAVGQTWEGAVPSTAGPWELAFTAVGYSGGGMVPGECSVGATDPGCVSPPPSEMVHGMWRFSFELPEPAGRTVTTDATATVDGMTLSLTELRIAPSRITARVGLVVEDSPVAYWNRAIASIQHRATPFVVTGDRFVLNRAAGEAPELEFSTTAGSDDEAGTWEVVIAELVYGATTDEEIRAAGPWTLTVTVP